MTTSSQACTAYGRSSERVCSTRYPWLSPNAAVSTPPPASHRGTPDQMGQPEGRRLEHHGGSRAQPAPQRHDEAGTAPHGFLDHGVGRGYRHQGHPAWRVGDEDERLAAAEVGDEQCRPDGGTHQRDRDRATRDGTTAVRGSPMLAMAAAQRGGPAGTGPTMPPGAGADRPTSSDPWSTRADPPQRRSTPAPGPAAGRWPRAARPRRSPEAPPARLSERCRYRWPVRHRGPALRRRSAEAITHRGGRDPRGRPPRLGLALVRADDVGVGLVLAARTAGCGLPGELHAGLGHQ